MVIVTDPHTAILTTHACLMQGQWLLTDNLKAINAWWALLHNQITQWDFAKVWSEVTGNSDMTNLGVFTFLHSCLGHSA